MTGSGAIPRRPAHRTFRDRRDAGRVLAGLVADHLAGSGTPEPPLVLGLARGGVPVAWEVAVVLHAPLEVFLVRKLGVPSQPELAMGALAGGQVLRNERVIARLGIGEQVVQSVIESETTELRRREKAYRGNRPAADLYGRLAILIDDGIATGASALAAVRAARNAGARSVIVAAPVGPLSACRTIAREADKVICATAPARFDAVGQAYRDFHQVGDDEVRTLLATPTTDGPTG
ncbi:phosphoribosyltransferase [Mycolicibacter minnesotensis]